MAITGAKKEEIKSYKKTYGLGKYKVLGVNLTNKQLKEKGFPVKEEDLDKERDFVGEKNGNTTIMLEFACTSLGMNLSFKRFSFWIEDRYRRNNEESERVLYQFINDQGRTSWSTNPKKFVSISNNNNNFFTGVENSLNPRPAKVGEEEFMLFMRNCMAINWKEGGTLIYDVNKLLNGNLKELRQDLLTDYLSPILVATTIRIKQTDEGIKEYESFYSRAFAPGSFYSVVANKNEFNDDDVAAIHEKIKNNKSGIGKRQYVTPLEDLIARMTDPKYFCKDVYYLGVIKEYISDNTENSDKAVISESIQEPLDDFPF
jgi:hypothetical protein